MKKLDKTVSIVLRTIYIVAIVVWLIMACVLRIAETKAGIAMLDIIAFIGFGSWLLQNYMDWRCA